MTIVRRLLIQSAAEENDTPCRFARDLEIIQSRDLETIQTHGEVNPYAVGLWIEVLHGVSLCQKTMGLLANFLRELPRWMKKCSVLVAAAMGQKVDYQESNDERAIRVARN